MGLCCCLSLQKGVVVIGVISMISSSVFVVMNFVTGVTFEEHILACRQDEAKDMLRAFPECDVLTDASMLIAGRIFIYIPLLVWTIEIITSILLVVAAIKKRSSLMLPWMIVSIVVVLILGWNIYQTALGDNLINLLLLISTLLIAVYFLVVVKSFSKQLSREVRCYFPEHSSCQFSPTEASLRQSCCKLSGGPSSSRNTTLDKPPAYTPFSATSKGPLPINLGLKH